jgi:hypothetical protein
MRLPNENSGSTSLFPQPVELAAVPLDSPISKSPGSPIQPIDSRLEAALASLNCPTGASAQVLSDHLSLFGRWFYSSANRRVGEVHFLDGQNPAIRKPILRAIARVAAASLKTDFGSSQP